jgi:hypothetical protein
VPLRPFLRPPKSGHCFGRNELVWDGLKLKLGTRVVATIEPDAKWSGMWRVRWPDDSLSDMTNLTRAKDAVACFMETEERRQRGRHSPSEGRLCVKTRDLAVC